MEEKNVTIEEIIPDEEKVETNEVSTTAVLAVGAIGGLAACAIGRGVKWLSKHGSEKLKRKKKGATNDIIDAEIVEVEENSKKNPK